MITYSRGLHSLPRYDPELLAISQEFAADNGLFITEFRQAWTKLANADRFDGPAGNICSHRLPKMKNK